jgi:hypothetical protein
MVPPPIRTSISTIRNPVLRVDMEVSIHLSDSKAKHVFANGCADLLQPCQLRRPPGLFIMLTMTLIDIVLILIAVI